jgi:hypothetical protein
MNVLGLSLSPWGGFRMSFFVKESFGKKMRVSGNYDLGAKWVKCLFLSLRTQPLLSFSGKGE